MDEIVEALKSRAIPQTVPIGLPDEDDLVEIEEEILLPIPQDFKEFLLQASNLLCGSIEPVTASDPHAHTHLPEVTAQAWAEGIPRDLIPICHTGNSYYCVNQEGEVQLWQDGELEDEYWEDVWQWAEEVWLDS